MNTQLEQALKQLPLLTAEQQQQIALAIYQCLCQMGLSQPPNPTGRRPYGLAAGQFVVPDDFNEPLPDDILSAFETA